MQQNHLPEWVDLGYMADKTGFDEVTLRRLIESGDLPAMQVASASATRTFHKIPRRLVDEAYAAVMAGAQVELRAFCRQWSARNAAPEAVALDGLLSAHTTPPAPLCRGRLRRGPS